MLLIPVDDSAIFHSCFACLLACRHTWMNDWMNECMSVCIGKSGINLTFKLPSLSHGHSAKKACEETIVSDPHTAGAPIRSKASPSSTRRSINLHEIKQQQQLQVAWILRLWGYELQSACLHTQRSSLLSAQPHCGRDNQLTNCLLTGSLPPAFFFPRDQNEIKSLCAKLASNLTSLFQSIAASTAGWLPKTPKTALPHGYGYLCYHHHRYHSYQNHASAVQLPLQPPQRCHLVVSGGDGLDRHTTAAG